MSFGNTPVPNAREYYPNTVPAVGTLLNDEKSPKLFQPLTIRGVTFKNRIFVSPMCQYSSDNGHATDWHLVHIGGFATRGAGAICLEATSVTPEGRISPEDAGLWTDSQMAPLKRIVEFCHAHGTLVGIQLAHAGRKASTLAPWARAKAGHGSTYLADEKVGGWPENVVGPSPLPFNEQYPKVKELTEAQLDDLENAFLASVKRVEEIGFDFIEIHNAHGYLFNSFVSPLSNIRSDKFGGQALENRLRYPLRVIKAIREVWSKPLFVRISASDWAEGPEKDEAGVWKQWGIEQSTIFTGEMLKLGVDLVDCSSGGNWTLQKFSVGPGYQVPYAEALKKAHPDMLVGAVGMIVDPEQAEDILQSGKADVVFLARELMRNPHWPIHAAKKLGAPVQRSVQYDRGF